MTREAQTMIRRAGQEDAGALARLGATTFTETFGHLYAREDLESFLVQAHGLDTWARTIGDPAVATWLAVTAEGAPAGYLVAGPCKLPVPEREPAAGEIRQLYLRRTCQGRGIGTELLEIGLNWLVAQGHAPLYVGVWSENRGAQRLYGRYGFEKIGEYDFPVGRHLDREYILRRLPGT